MRNATAATLIDTLDRERACCERLIEVSRAEQASMVANDPDALAERIEQMRRALAELQALHRERNRLVETLARSLGIARERVSLPAIAERLGVADGSALRRRTAELMRVARTLYQTNEQTLYLVNFSLDLIDRQVRLWTQVLTRDDGYDAEGHSARTAEPALVEEKA